MRDLPTTKYLWQIPYQAAVLETNNELMQVRIYEALAAIEQRRLAPVDPQSHEAHLLTIAEERLRALCSERLPKADGDS